MVSEPAPIHGCPRETDLVHWDGEPPKYGATWPTYLAECPSCDRPYVWSGAHYESGLHYVCAPCGGWPFWSPDEVDEVYHLDGMSAGYGQKDVRARAGTLQVPEGTPDIRRG